MLADEFICHLRSILDQCVVMYVEAERNPVTRATCFPIHVEEPKPDSRQWCDYEACVAGMPAGARGVVDEAQPYTRGKAAKSHPLYLLREVSNILKHRSMDVLSFQIGAPNVPGGIRSNIGEVLNLGDPFGKIPVTVDVKKDFEPYISGRPAFRMPIAGRPNVWFEAMDEMYDFVRDEVVLKLISTRRRAGLRRE